MSEIWIPLIVRVHFQAVATLCKVTFCDVFFFLFTLRSIGIHRRIPTPYSSKLFPGSPSVRATAWCSRPLFLAAGKFFSRHERFALVGWKHRENVHVCRVTQKERRASSAHHSIGAWRREFLSCFVSFDESAAYVPRIPPKGRQMYLPLKSWCLSESLLVIPELSSSLNTWMTFTKPAIRVGVVSVLWQTLLFGKRRTNGPYVISFSNDKMNLRSLGIVDKCFFIPCSWRATTFSISTSYNAGGWANERKHVFLLSTSELLRK